MDTFIHLSSTGDNAETVLQDCLKQLVNCPAEANFGFIYVSDILADSLENILHHCKITSGIKHWAGSLGIGIIANDKEIYDQATISLLLCQFDEAEFTMLKPVTNSDELLENAVAPVNSETCFAFLHADGHLEQAQSLIADFPKIIDNAFAVGGFTSSRTLQLQIANEVTSGSLSGVLFSEKIPILSNLTQGCSPLGGKHRVTQAEQNVAFSLDHKPALDVFYNDIGEVLARDTEKATTYVFVGLCIPGSDKSDYMVRTLAGINQENKVFAINDYLHEGQEILFCRRDNNTAVDDMLSMLQQIKKRLNTQPKGGIYVSCVGRSREQFGSNSEEIQMIRQVLGDFPLSGFFANGEIHHNHVYGYTGVLTLFL